jgi:hypothetical protein
MRFTPSEQLGRSAAERGYRIAFEDFSQQARNFQRLTAQPNQDRAAVDAALLDLENAHLAYTNSRNALANQLSRATVDTGSLSDTRSLQANVDRIRSIAKLLWEVAGKPEGSALDDWHRAEEIIRRAVAAQTSPGIEVERAFSTSAELQMCGVP